MGIHIEKSSDGYRLESLTELPYPRSSVFSFFADAQNLQQLTPDFLDFRITTEMPIEMQEGARIDYRLKVHGLPISWTSEITTWQPPHLFVDTQIRGPYSYWIHEHHFEERNGSTIVADRVCYRPRGGALIHELFVRRDLERIFTYRLERLDEIFPKNETPALTASI